MTTEASTLMVKSLDRPEETRPTADKGRLELVSLGDVTAGRATFLPGWRWSDHVKPIAGTDLCEAPHTGYCISGRMMIRMEDGTESEIGPGDAFVIPPRHDGWVLGDEPCVTLDFSGYRDYAKPH